MSTTLAPTLRVLRAGDQFPPSRRAGMTAGNSPVVGGCTATGYETGAFYYMSHARFGADYTFDEHTHTGFEILSIVLDGSTAHCESGSTCWTDLYAGDMQFIRSGRGLTHAELVRAGTRTLRIWFDPGFDASVAADPWLRDYDRREFVQTNRAGLLTTPIVGGGGPIEARTAGVDVTRLRAVSALRRSIPVGADRLVSLYVVTGIILVGGHLIAADEMALLATTDTAEIDFGDHAEVIMISSPAPRAAGPDGDVTIDVTPTADHDAPLFPGAGLAFAAGVSPALLRR